MNFRVRQFSVTSRTKLVPGSLGKVGLDFDGDLDFRSHQAGQVLDDFLGDSGCIPAKAERVNLHGTVEP